MYTGNTKEESKHMKLCWEVKQIAEKKESSKRMPHAVAFGKIWRKTSDDVKEFALSCFDWKSLLLTLAETENGCGLLKLLTEEYGFDPQVPDEQGRRPIYHAVRAGLPGNVRVLLEHEDRNTVSEVCKFGESLLVTAFNIENSQARFDIVEMLLQAGVDVDSQNEYGYTALHHIADSYYQYDDACVIAERLMDFGADLHIRSNEGETPYDIANMLGATSMTKCLHKEMMREMLRKHLKVSDTHMWYSQKAMEELASKVEKVE